MDSDQHVYPQSLIRILAICSKNNELSPKFLGHSKYSDETGLENNAGLRLHRMNKSFCWFCLSLVLIYLFPKADIIITYYFRYLQTCARSISEDLDEMPHYVTYHLSAALCSISSGSALFA